MTFDLPAAQEGLSKRIDLKEQDPHLAARMLQHLYGFDYSAHKTSIGDDEEPSYVSELHTHAEMYALGDEYDIKELKEEALWKFQKAIDAMKGHSEELPNILEVIPTVYATTPDSDRGLRDAIVAFGARDLDRIRDLPEFKSAATRVPIYLIEVLPKFFERFGGRYYESDCPTCDNADNWMFTHVECSKCQYEETLYDSEKAPASR